MSALRPLAVLLALCAPALGAPARPSRAVRPARTHSAPADKPAPTARAAPPQRPAAASPDAQRPDLPADPALFALGLELAAEHSGLQVLVTRPGSRAAALGLRPGDRLLWLDHQPVSTRAQAAAVLRAWAPGSRLSAVVRRGEEIKTLQAGPAPRPAAFGRGPGELSARERALAGERAAQDSAAAAAAVRSVPAPAFTARAEQSIWVRFPKGLPASLKDGDIVETEAATGLTTDASLDFLSVPPRSRLWARAVESSMDGETRSVRLVFFKLAVADGSTYPISGVAAGVSGDQTLARVSPGGTLVTAAPLPDPSGSRPWPDLLDAASRLRVRLLEPVVLVEPPSFWRAGPGLWIRTAERDGKRLYEVTHVAPGRAAAAAGVKVGELVESVDGRSSKGLDFAEALDRLYGPPGSKVSLTLLLDGKGRRVELQRGVLFDALSASPLPLPVKYQ